MEEEKPIESNAAVEKIVKIVEEIERKAQDRAWKQIFDFYNIHEHDFDAAPFSITAKQINTATTTLTLPSEKEARILVKHDTRENRPRIFREKGLFMLATQNGVYSIIKGEGYIDIPPIKTTTEVYTSKLDFQLDTSKIGNSEMQHLDFAYASSLIRTFLNDDSLVLTIRGKKFSPDAGFKFLAGKHEIEARSVQTEVDSGYEGRSQIVLVEAKATGKRNTIIRQLYYPFRQWQHHTKKQVVTLFFETYRNVYSFWEFQFPDPMNYNSITLTRAQSFTIKENASQDEGQSIKITPASTAIEE
jgi:hypothetical protein